MSLSHERLDVYQLSLEFVVLASAMVDALPKGKGHLADQFTRASPSILLNLAEGTGKQSKLEQRRYYLIARGSATESAALLDVYLRLKLVDESTHGDAKTLVVRIVAMLFKLARSC
jgi:four helix bundle protein